MDLIVKAARAARLVASGSDWSASVLACNHSSWRQRGNRDGCAPVVTAYRTELMRPQFFPDKRSTDLLDTHQMARAFESHSVRTTPPLRPDKSPSQVSANPRLASARTQPNDPALLSLTRARDAPAA